VVIEYVKIGGVTRIFIDLNDAEADRLATIANAYVADAGDREVETIRLAETIRDEVTAIKLKR